jgi:hypothetical protein
MSFDKELLFKSRLGEADVEIPGVGTVRVRGLSRAEVMSIQNTAEGTEAIERKMLALALIDPKLTEEEVGKWQHASVAGELEPVTHKVTELSGMGKDAAKDAYKEFESNPDSEFRLPPSGEA